MARRILTQAKPVMTELDKMIFQMENVLGKPHVASPFPGLLNKYMPVEQPKVEAKPVVEETKAAPQKVEQKPAEKPKQASKEEKKEGQQQQ